MKGHAIIHNPTLPESVKRRRFILDSLEKFGVEWTEEIEDNRIVITYAGEPKQITRRPVARKVILPAPITLEKCLKERYGCEPDDIEYWDEMIRLTAEREGAMVGTIAIRDGWNASQWRDTWAVIVSEYLAVNRGRDYWAFTHVPTGLAAGTAQKLKDAIRIAGEIACWPEWSLLRQESDISPEFRQKATEAFGRVAA